MSKKTWFSKKRIGYGVRPVSWQGWVATLIFCAIVGGAGMYFIPQNSPIVFIVIALVSFAALLLLIKMTFGDVD